MSSELREYQYQELVDGHIRLLRLNPGRLDDDIVCDLFEAPLPMLLNRSGTPPSDEVPPEDGLQSAVPKYEALSWCWGKEKRTDRIRIRFEQEDYAFSVTRNLKTALRHLRYINKVRNLWIDLICIHQANFAERNSQVPRMNVIYGCAENVCVWIGEGDQSSRPVLQFINDNVLDLWKVEDFSRSPEMAPQWTALWKLMQREWFSRRWVIQEIALANTATLHCGSSSIKWDKFAIAVSLFVDLESKHRHVSSVIKKDANYRNVPNFFGNVHEVGAAILVDATSNLFRKSPIGSKEPLLSLEYLVSRYTIFESTQSRDTIYALLAIARDTTPKSERFTIGNLRAEFDNKSSTDHQLKDRAAQKAGSIFFLLFQRFVQWLFPKAEHVPPSAALILRAFGRNKIRSQDFRVDYRLPVADVYKDFVEFSINRSEPNRALDILCRPWARPVRKRDNLAGLHEAMGNKGTAAEQESLDALEPLPSWICTQTDMPFAIKPIGGDPRNDWRVERRKADALVGLPLYGHRNYNAAGGIGISRNVLRFRKGPSSYSLFIEGFVLDTLVRVEEKASLGNVPSSWFEAGGWKNRIEDPPEEFWRTLVANRGPDGRNPYSYYSKACKEGCQTLHDRSALDTRKIIEEGSGSIVSDFWRRVQDIIWDRRLVRTKENRLGLVHEDAEPTDSICILFGCSIPVILRRYDIPTKDAELHRKFDERALEKETRDVAALITKIRRQQIQKRNSSKAWRRKKEMKALLWALRVTLLVGLILYFTLERRSVLETTIVIVTLILLSPTQIRRLAPIRWRDTRVGHSWWALLKHTAFGRLLLFILCSWRLYQLRAMSMQLTIVFCITGLLFPRILQVPLGVTDLNLAGRLSFKVFMMRIRLSSFGTTVWRQVMWSQSPVPSKPRPKPSSIPGKHYWKLVGPCYLHGMMDGDAISESNMRQLPREVFELR